MLVLPMIGICWPWLLVQSALYWPPFMTEAWKQDHDAEGGHIHFYNCAGPERAGNLVPANYHSWLQTIMD